MANLTIPAGAGNKGNAISNNANNCVMRLRYNITTGDTRACSIKASTTEAACVAAGKSEADARAFLDDKSAMRAAVEQELHEAQGVRGVPYFIIRQPGKDAIQISGALPPEVFERAFR